MRRANGHNGGYGYHFNGDYLYDEAVGPMDPHFTVRCDVWGEYIGIQNIIDADYAAWRLRTQADALETVGYRVNGVEVDHEQEIIVISGEPDLRVV